MALSDIVLNQILKEDAEIDFSDFESFFSQVVEVRSISYFKKACDNAKSNNKTPTAFFNRCTHSFMGDTNYIVPWGEQEKLVKLTMLDYYYPEYITDFLLPYINSRKTHELKRAEWRKNVMTGSINRNINGITNLGDNEKAEKIYYETCAKWEKDWSDIFIGIKEINETLRTNEQNKENAINGCR